ncbi:MAG: 3-isopropylmalate dehydratase small subunit [Planctomycetes bacterium]|nr:3-isopropylmalate dehydratase small subunit [Planctomycetota bacterium]
MNEIKSITGSGIPLFLDEIDTDRIIPARYLRCVTFDGIGEHVFEDDRKQDPHHPFDDDRYQDGGVLISGRNFGCGSSREHAPQALMRWGVKAVVAESFAEIFFGNCTSLGIPAVCLNRDELEQLSAAIQNDPSLEITVDLVAREVRYGDTSAQGTIPESARLALVSGQWDFLSQLLEGETQVRETAAKIPYVSGFPA